MYRAVALKALRRGIAIDSDHAIARSAGARHAHRLARAGRRQQVFLDGEDVTGAIRDAGGGAGGVENGGDCRACAQVLVAEQRRAGQQGGVVMEGRDIGSVVFPDAQLKIFLDGLCRSTRRAPLARAPAERRSHRPGAGRSKRSTSATGATRDARHRRWFARRMPSSWTALRWSRTKSPALSSCSRASRRLKTGTASRDRGLRQSNG